MKFKPDGWLEQEQPSNGPDIIIMPTMRKTKLSVSKPLAIVWHCTECPATALSLAKRIVDLPSSKVAHKASWHFLIDRDGTIYQQAPINVGTWHTGIKHKICGKLRNVNECTIGIEIVNAGRCKKINNVFYMDPYDTKKSSLIVPSNRVTRTGVGYFEDFTVEQRTAAVELTKAIKASVGKIDSLSHGEIDPDRREDPGPLWPIEALRLLGK